MRMIIYGAPSGAAADARPDDSKYASSGAPGISADVPTPALELTAEKGPCSASETDVRRSLSTPVVAEPWRPLRTSETSCREAYFDRVEAETDLDNRAFTLSLRVFAPYDERTRDLVRSVSDAGPVGAAVQNLLHSPEPMPESILVPVRLPKRPKLPSMKLCGSLFEYLTSNNDKTA
ncbi:hypothetical protein [Methylobacterium oryzae]|uniref:hypothetical protein n=1 Tax=Methylobacterium oryzae TaxID=334852 RepID=UPI001F38F1A5|nr:hypothetical protein [Methylobacterium oryzae]UIN37349.1 hypothetical protein LXM90_12940 [Methylobacterium oryzae]